MAIAAEPWPVRWAVLTVLLALPLLHPGRPPWQPAPIPCHRCETWMAECLPGVGPKTSTRMTQAIRTGRIEVLPVKARSLARTWFSGWPP